MTPRMPAAACIVLASLALSFVAVLFPLGIAPAAENLVEDPSFEVPKEKDRFGLVFAKWGGWKYEGDCDFAVGRVARTGKTSCLLVGGAGAKIRVAQLREIEAGRYRITAYIRGLDIGTGTWNMTTEFMFDGKYIQLEKNGTFGWTKLVHVADVAEKKEAGPSFGMMAPGYFWIDDVSMERVGADVALTEKPVLGPEEAPLEPPGEIGPGAVRCPECGYRNMPAWKTCYACGGPLEERQAVSGPPLRIIASFEGGNPFPEGKVVEEHATDGRKALRIDRSYASMDREQDWTGFDFLKADLFADAKDPVGLYVEVRDRGTRDYWTRVNYQTIVPPGSSTLIIPIRQLYVGEKSRPGRMLDLAGVTRLVFSIGDRPPGPLYVDHIRLERDDAVREVLFDGLFAFDLGTGTSPVLEGFTAITPSTRYSRGRGYGLRDARIWRAFDALQPEPLYQDFIAIEAGGLSVDVPNGRYRVFLNIDSPSGFWGEYQVFRRRAVLAEGKEVAADTMDFESFRRKYFRFWGVEDLPSENTFDKYQKVYFREKTFEVDVTDGRLDIEFRGENWACCVSTAVIFPVAKAPQGERFLRYVEDKRRFHFDNYFKRILHRPTGDPVRPSDEDERRGYIVFVRDFMEDLYDNDTPRAEEIGRPLAADAFPGEIQPLSLAILPLRDLGKTTVAIGDLAGPAGTIPAGAIDIGSVSYRLSRVTMEGTVYTIAPRLILPSNAIAMPKGVARRFRLAVRTPADAKPGVYEGTIEIRPARGSASRVPMAFTVRSGTLDPVDVPAGPWGYTISIPWYREDPAAAAWNRAMVEKSFRMLRGSGFTAASGIPHLVYRGFRDGKPSIDFAAADREMRMAKEAGFLAVVSYGSGLSGINAYVQDGARMQEAGFTDYAAFIRAVYAEIQGHADAEGWLPVFWNLSDEPIGDDLTRSIENARAYREAFPAGPPFFTGATSFTGGDRNDPHFLLSTALHVADWNTHDEASVRLLREAGGDWAFYNGGNRWTYGTYLYKAAKEFGLRFRLSWHWNVVAGDPYYALDCREDDYAWCNASPDGELIPSIGFERLREGLDDYRYMLTLARLARAKAGTPEALAAEALIRDRLGAFRLGQRDGDAIFGRGHFEAFRRRMADAIESLRTLE